MVVKQGDTFEIRSGKKRVDTFRREADDPSPRFESERIRVTHLSQSYVRRDGRLERLKFKPYTFGTEPEWFVQRGLEAG